MPDYEKYGDNSKREDDLYRSIGFDPVFLPPAEGESRFKPAAFNTVPESPEREYGGRFPSFSASSYPGDYEPYTVSAEEVKPKRGYGRLLSGFAAGFLCAFVIGSIVYFSLKGEGAPPFVFPTSSPSGAYAPEATSSPPAQALKPMGGGDAELTIVPAAPEAEASPLPGEKLSVRQIADKIIPAVVCILTEMPGTSDKYSGSGVIMTSDGYVITNAHVINGAARITVILSDGAKKDAKITGQDISSDLAVLKIDGTDLPTAEFGDSDSVRVGDAVVAVGNPLGLDLQGTVTDGIVSAINRGVKVSGSIMTLIQTNAAINPGNSGGALVDEYGRVVGIVSSKIMGNILQTAEGLGFAIPVSSAKPVIDRLIADGYVSGRPTIGIIELEDVDRYASRFYKVPQGVKVLKIDERSDAYKQGMRVGDIITKADGETVTDAADLRAVRDKHKAGESMTVSLYRDGDTLDVTFKLAEEAELNG